MSTFVRMLRIFTLDVALAGYSNAPWWTRDAATALHVRFSPGLAFLAARTLGIRDLPVVTAVARERILDVSAVVALFARVLLTVAEPWPIAAVQFDRLDVIIDGK